MKPPNIYEDLCNYALETGQSAVSVPNARLICRAINRASGNGYRLAWTIKVKDQPRRSMTQEAARTYLDGLSATPESTWKPDAETLAVYNEMRMRASYGKSSWRYDRILSLSLRCTYQRRVTHTGSCKLSEEYIWDIKLPGEYSKRITIEKAQRTIEEGLHNAD